MERGVVGRVFDMQMGTCWARAIGLSVFCSLEASSSAVVKLRKCKCKRFVVESERFNYWEIASDEMFWFRIR
jgi:hypothetical protein